MTILSSIKLIYQDGDQCYFVRYSNGQGERVSKAEAEKLSSENNVPIGQSQQIPNRYEEIIWN